ncbi:hypothetical protein ABGB18_42570 [Nonomuraea sp. B12E4]
MAKVTIYTKGDRDPIEVDASPEDEAFYDDLPFNSDNVVMTRVEPGRSR